MHIVLIQGHPDAAGHHLCHALAGAYADGARAAGHTIEVITPANIAFPLLGAAVEWENGALPASLMPAQQAIGRARHIVLIYPLWLGDMPALLKAFLEQVARPGFAIARNSRNPLRAGLLGGRSARIVITMGMPALLYRWYYAAPGLRVLERHILRFAGIAPVRNTLIGAAGSMTPARLEKCCALMGKLGRRAR